MSLDLLMPPDSATFRRVVQAVLGRTQALGPTQPCTKVERTGRPGGTALRRTTHTHTHRGMITVVSPTTPQHMGMRRRVGALWCLMSMRNLDDKVNHVRDHPRRWILCIPEGLTY
jgi:hypothetical protein